MYKPKKQIRLDVLDGLPKMSDLKTLLSEANRSKGSTVELPFRGQTIGFSLTVRVEVGGAEPIWTLYEGQGKGSRVVWSSPFEDLELLYDVLCLSLPQEVGKAALPPEVTQEVSKPAAVSEHEPSPPPSYKDLDPYTSSAETATSTYADEFFKEAEREKAAPPPAPAPAPAQPAPSPAPQPQAPPPYPYPQAMPPGYPYPPAYPPPGYGYPQYPPGYAYPPGYGYPPGYPAYPPGYPPPVPPNPADPYGQQGAQAPQYPYGQPQQPAQQQAPQQAPATSGPKIAPDPDLLKKRPNVLLGHFLVEAGLVPEPTLNAALQLQEMVKAGSLTSAQAAEAVRRAHERGGKVDPNVFTATPPRGDISEAKPIAPPLGEILVQAGLITMPVLKAALTLQEVVRTGAMSKEDAVEGFIREHFGAAGKPGAIKNEPKNVIRTLDLLKKAGLLADQDLQTAMTVKKKHGGELPKILMAAGKLDDVTFGAATTCDELINESRLKIEQAIIALHFCQRSRVTFDEAVEELGWEKP